MFTDLNRYAARPDPSLNILYDRRDREAVLSKMVMKSVKIFDKLTDTERSSLPPDPASYLPSEEGFCSRSSRRVGNLPTISMLSASLLDRNVAGEDAHHFVGVRGGL